MDTCLGCASLAGTGHCPGLLPGRDATSQSPTSLWTVRAARDLWLSLNSENSTCKVTLPSAGARGDMVVAGHSTRPGPGGHSPCQRLAVLAGDTSLSRVCGSSPVNRPVWTGCASASWQDRGSLSSEGLPAVPEEGEMSPFARSQLCHLGVQDVAAVSALPTSPGPRWQLYLEGEPRGADIPPSGRGGRCSRVC